MPSPWYIAACLLIPMVWGLIVAAIYERLAIRRDRAKEEAEVFMDFEI
jgi:hypothetical protein